MENKEKQIFDEMQEKQSKFAKKLLFGTFCGMGILFVILGLIFLFLNTAESKELTIVYLSIGAFMVVLGIILYFLPMKYNYEKYKLRLKKYGAVNIFEISAKITELEERISELERKNSNK